MTAEGKAVHSAIETGDDRGLPEHLAGYARMCRELVDSVVPKGASTHKEIRFPIEGEDFGYADLVAIQGQVAYLVDYKIGFNKQEEVEVNPAAQAYALGIMKTWPYVQKVRVWYAYPRLEEVSYGEYTRADIPRIVARIRLIKERHNKATPETCAYHDDTCVYCQFLGTCSTAARTLLPIQERYAAERSLPPMVVPDTSAITDQKTWSLMLRAVPTLEALADSIKRRALEWRDNTGIEIDGYTVREKKGARTITDPAEAWKKAKEHGVTESEFLACVKVPVAEYIDAIRATAPKGEKKAIAQLVLDALEDSGAMTVGEPSRFLGRDKSTDSPSKP